MTQRHGRPTLLQLSLLNGLQRSCERAGWPARGLLCTSPHGQAGTGRLACRELAAGAAAAADAAAAVPCVLGEQQQQRRQVLAAVPARVGGQVGALLQHLRAGLGK